MRSVIAALVMAGMGVAPALAQAPGATPPVTTVPLPPAAPPTAPPAADQPPPLPPQGPATFAEEDVLGAAEDVFGKGAEGLAEIVRKSMKQYGQPTGYIVGREAGGAIIFGLRYGSGKLYHKVEGEMPVHWTGPSVGFDIGGDGSKTFALVYNLNDTEDLFQRYPAAEGKAYLIGGFTANYLQRDDVVIVPIKLGVGWRLGLNAGYLKFSKKGKVVPF
jgi:hypothetical protein